MYSNKHIIYISYFTKDNENYGMIDSKSTLPPRTMIYMCVCVCVCVCALLKATAKHYLDVMIYDTLILKVEKKTERERKRDMALPSKIVIFV